MYKIINRRKLAATMAADLIGRATFLPWKILRRKETIEPARVRSILVIRTAYIGDVMMTVPVLGPLRKRFPGARISFLTSAGGAEVLKNNPFIDETVVYDAFWFHGSEKVEYLNFRRRLRKMSFDLIIEARADIRDLLFIVWPLKARHKVSYGVGGGAYFLTDVVPYPGLKHKVEYHLDLARYLKCPVNDLEWGVYLTGEEETRVREILASRGVEGPFVAVHPGARIPLKRWLKERYALFYDQVMEKYGRPLVILGSLEESAAVDNIIEKMREKPINLAGKISLRELSGVLARASMFIGNDTAPIHIAASMGTPTVAIFGPSKSVETAPYGTAHRVVEKGFPCRVRCDENTCRYRRFHACMEDISVEDVMAAVEDLFREVEN